MSRKIRYVAANIIAPGVGHFAMKKWLRGLVYLLGTVICLVWLIVSFVQNVIGMYYKAMDSNDIAFDNPVTFLISLLAPIAALCLVWAFSYIDIFFFCKPVAQKEENP